MYIYIYIYICINIKPVIGIQISTTYIDIRMYASLTIADKYVQLNIFDIAMYLYPMYHVIITYKGSK